MSGPQGILLSALAAPLSHSPVRGPWVELRPRASKFPNNWPCPVPAPAQLGEPCPQSQSSQLAWEPGIRLAFPSS